MKKRSFLLKLVVITFIMSLAFISFINLNLNLNLNSENIASNSQKIKIRTPDNLKYNYIPDNLKYNYIEGVGNSCNVIQYVQRQDSSTNFEVLKPKFGIPSNLQSYVGNVSGNINITEIKGYNISKIQINITNITTRPTWKDVENNYSSNFYSIHSASNPRMYGDVFNIYSEYERLERISFYGRVVYSSGNYSIEIWNRTNQWSGTPSSMLWKKILTNEIGPATQWWTIDIGGLNLSRGSYVFVINAWNLTRTGVEEVAWSYLFDGIVDPTDNKNETTVYKKMLSWSEEPDVDLSMKYETTIIDNQNNTLTNINGSRIDMNITVCGTTKDVPNNGSLTFTNLNEVGNVSCLIDANSSFIINYSWSAHYYNFTKTTISRYTYSMGNINSTWNFNFTVSFPLNSYNYSFKVIKNSPEWILIHAYNSSSQLYDKSNEIIQIENEFYVLNTSLLGESTWIFYCNNTIIGLNLFKNNSRTFNTNEYYTYSDPINISSSVSATNGVMNLSVFNSLNQDVTVEWCSNPSGIVNSKIDFNLTVPNSANTGYYTVQVAWDNYTHVGLSKIQLCVINSTQLDLITVNEFPTLPSYRYVGEILNLTVFFNDTSQNKFTGIPDANVTLQIFNLTDLSEVLRVNLSQDILGQGLYNYSIDTSSFVNGSYRMIINASKKYYQNWTIQQDFDLIYNTTLTKFNSSELAISSIYLENITLNFNYSEYSTGREIDIAKLEFKVNSTKDNTIIDSGFLNLQPDNTYKIQLNSSDYGVGEYKINITAYVMGYQTRTVFVD
ncbi:MAG: hypothetical protein ACTSQS_18750, partial [Promethearchaeota archaeon]